MVGALVGTDIIVNAEHVGVPAVIGVKVVARLDVRLSIYDRVANVDDSAVYAALSPPTPVVEVIVTTQLTVNDADWTRNILVALLPIAVQVIVEGVIESEVATEFVSAVIETGVCISATVVAVGNDSGCVSLKLPTIS